MKKLNKIIALLLALVMCMSFLSVSVFAADEDGAENTEYSDTADIAMGEDTSDDASDDVSDSDASGDVEDVDVSVTITEVTNETGEVIGNETTTVTVYAPEMEAVTSEPVVTETTETVAVDDEGNPATSKTTTTTTTTTEITTTTVEETRIEGKTQETLTTETKNEGEAESTERELSHAQIYSDSKDENGVSQGAVTVEGELGKTVTVEYGVNDIIVDKLLDGEYTADESYEASEDENGNTVYTKTEDGAKYTWESGEIHDQDGNFIGYSETETKVTVETETGSYEGRDAAELAEAGYVVSEEDVNVYTLTVIETLEDGTIVTTVTTVDIAKNTTETTTTTTESTTNVKFVTVNEAGTLTVTFGTAVQWTGHGKQNVSSLQRDYDTVNVAGSDLATPGSTAQYIESIVEKVQSYQGVYSWLWNTAYYEDYETWRVYEAIGMRSNIMPGYTNHEQVDQVILYDADGNPYYAYCADESVQYNRNAKWYEPVSMDEMTYVSEEAAQTVAAIAENGYWGAASGAGSMDAFKAWLVDLGYEGDLNALTPGIAEAVTAAAIWHYGSSNQTTVLDKDPTWSWSKTGTSSNAWNPEGLSVWSTPAAAPTNQEEVGAKLKLADELYKTIINQGDEGALSANNKTVDRLDKEDIGNPTVTVKQMGQTGNNTYYKTDLSFEINADFDSINFTGSSGSGVYVKDSTSKWVYGTLSKNEETGKTVVTINDMCVQEGGTALSIQIKGTQTIPQSAQLVRYWNGDTSVSQTLVTVVEGTRDVWMGFTMQINAVTDARITKTEQKTVETAVEVTEVKQWASDEVVTTKVTTTNTETGETVVYTYPEPTPPDEPKPPVNPPVTPDEPEPPVDPPVTPDEPEPPVDPPVTPDEPVEIPEEEPPSGGTSRRGRAFDGDSRRGRTSERNSR